MTPEEMARCKAKNIRKFSVAGVALGAPGDPVLERLGKPVKLETSSRYGDSQYYFTFGTLRVAGNRQIAGITLWADPPTGELWPGIHIGSRREAVLDHLAQQGLCAIPQPDKNDIAFPHGSGAELLSLTFSEEGLLERVVLIQQGE